MTTTRPGPPTSTTIGCTRPSPWPRPGNRSLMDAAAHIRVRRRSLPIDRILLAGGKRPDPRWGSVFDHPGVVRGRPTRRSCTNRWTTLISGGVLGATPHHPRRLHVLRVLADPAAAGIAPGRAPLAMQAFPPLGRRPRRRGKAGRRAGTNGAKRQQLHRQQFQGRGNRRRRAPAPPAAGPRPRTRPGEIPLLVATPPRQTSLHRPECVVVARRPGRPSGRPRHRGLRPTAASVTPQEFLT